MIRYADDFVVHCHTRQDALESRHKLAVWLAPRGLAFNEDKTRVVSPRRGLRLPGIQRPPLSRQAADQAEQGGPETDPGTVAHRAAVPARDNAQAVIKRLNPIIRGWAAYYRTQVSSEVFNALDGYLWRLTYKWATISHANKPKRWVVDRYFGQFNRCRRDRWVFGDRHSGAYMHKFAWTHIVRHLSLRAGRLRTTPPCRILGLATAEGAPPINNTSLRLLSPGRSLPDLHGAHSSPSTTGRKSRGNRSGGWRPPGRRPPSSRAEEWHVGLG